ncbi:MAG: asparagine synthase (glutamine-hydrolyzing) [Bacteroidetes bacterium]|nr:MAG: asparagine synthase (glutamine-hydrolyzing) [Bacteroidota bacterium]REJ99711.1 MAG: asparagine synthase (glutamine-hydrolyzing) [Bacteroidota bacterium]REK32905.1 MAG: asparagine synthase (glutamine-hydrolyzing) [Bacteroidota bacterium]REK47710.1 MAG: asparagine synthase (glutamine-hydrolyzing) [Bacteroidota bacterium]
MCGIAGIFNTNGKSVDNNNIHRIDRALQHRGPDGIGTWHNETGNLLFVHRRLSILDPRAEGNQPMISHDGRYVIIHNGEIFNFVELKIELESKGHLFRTETDTEVILASFREWGEAMLHKFNGMWAFAIYDTQEKNLFLARDRFGIKPLYYKYNNGEFFFASEIKTIHSLLGSAAEPDTAVMKSIAQAGFEYHGSESTYLKNVKALPGGYRIRISAEDFMPRRWYDLKHRETPSTLSNQAIELQELLSDSCKLRLRSDVKIATCLSGGLDSSSITCLLHQIKTDPQESRFVHYAHESFIASFPGSQIDERKKAEALSRSVGNTLNIVDILSPDTSMLESAMKACDGPMHSMAFIPIWQLYKSISSAGFKVTLDGQGPDEMLGGYNCLQAAFLSAFRRFNIPRMLDVYNVYASQGESPQWSSKKLSRTILWNLMKDSARTKLKGGKLIDISDRINEELPPARRERYFSDPFDLSLYRQFFTSPLPAILNQFDRCSMASGVECRMPFMDYRVVEFLFSLPQDSKTGKGYTKLVLREAMKGIVPDSTRLDKNKLGFNAPMVEWFKGDLKSFMESVINSDTYLQSEYFDGKKLKQKWTAFINGQNDSFYEASLLWPSVHLTWWLNNKNQFA